MQGTRKILLAVSGMSPQIITETLYSLIQEGWIPDEIRLITTLKGRQNAVQQLLNGERYFQRLLDDYRVSHPIEFTEQGITVICDVHGNPLADLRTPQDNEAAADTICAVMRDLTHDNKTELHVSLAGGRKTMGFYAGYALSLFGRPQDSLSHVLVGERYESNPNFFYPTPDSHVIHSRDGMPLDARDAKVWLARIPFVRMRSRLPEILLNGTHSFSETVRLAREATENVCLTLYPRSRHYKVNDRKGKLSALHISLLLWAATRAQQGRSPIEPVFAADRAAAEEFLAVAEKYWLSLHTKTEEVLKRDGITRQWLEQNISKLNRELTQTLGPELAECCKLASRGSGRSRGYALPGDLEVEIKIREQQQRDD
ncbi:MAG: TIGR02584 family CRISPR-associated protein [Alcaligenaceae bacterium]|nr:TIGR02584 family CRISPR-associated protein [Alcaligenaceae bacterium]